MMTKRKEVGTFWIESEAAWYEKKIKEMMDLVDANSPFTDIQDRTETEVNAKGVPIIRLIAKKEDTIKQMMAILDVLPTYFQRLNDLKEKKAAAKMETRGGKEIPGMMNKFFEEREEI